MRKKKIKNTHIIRSQYLAIFFSALTKGGEGRKGIGWSGLSHKAMREGTVVEAWRCKGWSVEVDGVVGSKLCLLVLHHSF